MSSPQQPLNLADAGMRENRLLDNFRAHRSTTVCQMYFPSTTVVEMIGLAGIDAVLFDAEHGTFTREDLDDLCRVAEACDLLTIARMPDLEPATAQGFLDRGVQSIIGPGVSTATDAMKLVEGCRYAPLGKRGIGGAPRAARFRNVSTKERIDHVNRNTFVVAFLESPESLANLDAIMAVSGIDAYYVGPQDMALALGHPGEINHPEVVQAADKVRRAAVSRGRFYFGDLIIGERATNFFLDGAKAFLAKNKR